MPFTKTIKNINDYGYIDPTIYDKDFIRYINNTSRLEIIRDYFSKNKIMLVPGNYFLDPSNYNYMFEEGLVSFDYFDEYGGEDLLEFGTPTFFRSRFDDDPDYYRGLNYYNLVFMEKNITIINSKYVCIFTGKKWGYDENALIGSLFSMDCDKKTLKKLKKSNKLLCYNIPYKEDLKQWDAELLLKVKRSEIIPNVTIEYDSYFANVCLDVYLRLKNIGLNRLIEEHIHKPKQCSMSSESFGNIPPFNYNCTCGELRRVCYFNF